MRSVIQYLISSILLIIYGGSVCPLLESLDILNWGLTVLIFFSISYITRHFLVKQFVDTADCRSQVMKEFYIDFSGLFITGFLIGIFNNIIFGFPFYMSGLKVVVACFILGVFVASDLALARERKVINSTGGLSKSMEDLNKIFPLTTKFSVFAVFISFSLAFVILLVFIHDLDWVINQNQVNKKAVFLSVVKELSFIFVTLVGMGLNIIIFSFSKNLKLYFENQNRVLTEVSNGNLNTYVPVINKDEFGIMAHYTNEMIEGLKKLNSELHKTQDATIVALASLAETRDNETGAHIMRTQRYVKALAENLKHKPDYKDYLTKQTIDLLFKSAPLHDVGKVGIPDSILLKPGKLTDDEFKIMKNHTVIGKDSLKKAETMLGSNSFLRLAQEIAYSHHEKWNGTGYPEGLSGDKIPISGRLMALADVYDALICKRVYKEAFSHEKSRQIIIEGKGTHFDPNVIDVFLEVEDEFIKIAREHRDHN